jgi:hypothetical protein
MAAPLTLLATGRYQHAAGTAATVTVPAFAQVIGGTCFSSAGGSLVITPNGPNQTGTAQPTITLPAGVPFDLTWLAGLGMLGPGSTLSFVGTDSYVVNYNIQKIG